MLALIEQYVSLDGAYQLPSVARMRETSTVGRDMNLALLVMRPHFEIA